MRFDFNPFRGLAALAVLICAPAGAESWTDELRGEDGWLDASDFVLNNAVGFMPVPLIITEPAVGEGLGLAALFFHPPKGYSQEEFEAARADRAAGTQEEFVLPDITAAAAAYTNNGSWLVGGGHFAHWKDDTVRFQGFAGYASINLRFFGLPNLPPIFNGLEFNLEGLMVDLPISFRWKDTNFFIGAEYLFSKSETRFDLLPQMVNQSLFNLSPTLSALGAFVQYDSRDTIFTPSTGVMAEFKVKRNDETIGSDFNFTDLDLHVRSWWNLGEAWNLGLRVQAERVSGDAPFFAVPFISMRGMPAMRYQGTSVALVEAEARWAFHRRISMVGFVGSGKAADSWGRFSDVPSRSAIGLGIRYFMAEKLGMHVGIDVAEGPEETYWYLTMGSAWH